MTPEAEGTARPPRLATPADAAEIARVVNLAYRVEDFFIHGDRTSEAEVHAGMARPGGAFLVIDGEQPGTLVAAVQVELRGTTGYFGLLSVDPVEQRRGHARRLIAAVEDHCARHGCDTLDIDVVDLRTELPPFYAALGFVATDTAPFKDVHKLKRPAAMIVMRKALGREA